jgi:hypothetical protein
MKLDELEKMAKETAAFGVHPSGEYIYSFYTEQLQAFARLITEHEREACAKVCETYDQREMFNDEDMAVADSCAEAIRARGQS